VGGFYLYLFREPVLNKSVFLCSCGDRRKNVMERVEIFGIVW
jgi:hypothetical protein